MKVRFTIPGEPQGKGRPRTVRNGSLTRTYTPEKTASYENLIKLEYQRQNPHRPGWFNGEALRMAVTCFYGLSKSDSKKKREAKLDGAIRPTKKPDIDNILKAIFDALNGYAFEDDSQIVFVTAEKFYAEEPFVEVWIDEFR